MLRSFRVFPIWKSISRSTNHGFRRKTTDLATTLAQPPSHQVEVIGVILFGHQKRIGLQGGPLAVINGVITPINGLKNG